MRIYLRTGQPWLTVAFRGCSVKGSLTAKHSASTPVTSWLQSRKTSRAGEVATMPWVSQHPALATSSLQLGLQQGGRETKREHQGPLRGKLLQT